MANCPFNNENCVVTCKCGDVECHRYCHQPMGANFLIQEDQALHSVEALRRRITESLEGRPFYEIQDEIVVTDFPYSAVEALVLAHWEEVPLADESFRDRKIRELRESGYEVQGDEVFIPTYTDVEQILQRSLANGVNPHDGLSREMYGEVYDDEQRRFAKGLNFLPLYSTKDPEEIARHLGLRKTNEG